MTIQVTAIGEILFDVYPDYKKLGGAPFNFMYHIWKLTGTGSFISRIGADEEATEILKLLESRKFDVSNIQVDKKFRTGEVKVKLDANKVPEFEIIQNRAYDYIEESNALTELVVNSDLLYFGSLAQRNETSRTTIQSLANKANKVFCDLNIRQNFYNKEIINNSLEKSNAVKLNSDELNLVNELLLNHDYELVSSAQLLLKKYKLDLLCITKGSDGAYLFNESNYSHHKTTVPEIIDTVGAGDAYAAMMCIGYLNKWELEKINRLASEFAAAVCRIKGAISDDEKLYENFIRKIINE